MDGMWDFAGSGHIGEGETASFAVIWECQEEIGVKIQEDELCFVHLSHRVNYDSDRTYVELYFIIEHFEGKPDCAEPEKCLELHWFDGII